MVQPTGEGFSGLDSVHFPAVWKSSCSLSCSLSVLSWQLIQLKALNLAVELMLPVVLGEETRTEETDFLSRFKEREEHP